MKIYPAILTESLATLKEQVEIAKSLPGVEVIQIDIIDGLFADNLTVSPLDLPVVDFGELKCDLHLMVDEPLDFVWETVSIKHQLPIRAVVAQVEHMSSQAAFLAEVKTQGWKAGLSLDLNTPLEAIEESSWENLDILQLMGIEAGFQGQKFDERIIGEIKNLVRQRAERIKKHEFNIELIVDGGVKRAQFEALEKLGVDAVTLGSLLWTAEDPIHAYSDLNPAG